MDSQNFDFILRIIDAVGSVATAITLIIAIVKFKPRLRIIGECLLRDNNHYLITAYNNKNTDIEIETISFYKGNPRKIGSFPVYFVDYDENGAEVNPASKRIIVKKDSHVDVLVSFQKIVDGYDNTGEAIGKPFDILYVVVRDNKGNRYVINTKHNVEYFRKLS